MSAASSLRSGSLDPIRVFVVDDELQLREAICDLVASEADMEVVGAAIDAEGAVALAHETVPHVAVVDVKMRGGGPRAAADLLRFLSERRALLEHLVSAGEEERQRIATDVHDDSIQAMTAAGVRLLLLRREIDEPKQLDLLTDLEETIERSISRLRHLLCKLRPPALDHEGLAAALRIYIDESQDQAPTTYRLDDSLCSQPGREARISSTASLKKHLRTCASTQRPGRPMS